MYTLFLDFLSFCVKDPHLYLQQGGHKMTIILYIYLYIEKLEIVWEPNSSKYGKTKKHVYPIFGFSIFLHEGPTFVSSTGWPWNGSYYIYIYIYLYIERRSRFHEPQTAWNIQKQKKHMNWFLGFPIFFVKEPPSYLQQGGHKTWSKTPKKKTKKSYKNT